RGVRRRAVAGSGPLVVIGLGLAERSVRIVAGQTRELARALPEAGGVAEIVGLMRRVPGVGPVGFFARLGWFAMACPAELIHLDSREFFGILNCSCAAAGLHVIGAGAVAGFAANAELGRLNGVVRSENQRARGVA